VAVLACNIWGEGARPNHIGLANAVAQAYNGSLEAEHPAESRESGGKPRAGTLLAFRRSMEATNLPTFLKFGNA